MFKHYSIKLKYCFEGVILLLLDRFKSCLCVAGVLINTFLGGLDSWNLNCGLKIPSLCYYYISIDSFFKENCSLQDGKTWWNQIIDSYACLLVWLANSWHLLKHILCLFGTDKASLGFILKLWWADLSFWERLRNLVWSTVWTKHVQSQPYSTSTQTVIPRSILSRSHLLWTRVSWSEC